MHSTNLKGLIDSLGAEGFYHKLCTLLNEQQLSVDDLSYRELADACGVLPQLRQLREWSPDGVPVTALLRESNPGANTSLFVPHRFYGPSPLTDSSTAWPPLPVRPTQAARSIPRG